MQIICRRLKFAFIVLVVNYVDIFFFLSIPDPRQDMKRTAATEEKFPVASNTSARVCKCVRLVFIKVSTLLLLSIDCSASVMNGGAFCLGNSTKADFPLEVPKKISTPWVWDAVYNNKLKSVEVTVVSRAACAFNHTMWQMAVSAFPQYRRELAHGLVSNILVPVANATNDYSERVWRSFKGETLKCLYYRYGSSTPVAVIYSEVIVGKLVWLEQGTVNVMCPAPRMKFDLMRIGRIGDYDKVSTGFVGKEGDQKFISEIEGGKEDDSLSAAFPVCRKRDLASSGLNIRKRYGVSVCTATARYKREDMVEWLEFHKLLGVDHFFIYNTGDQTSMNAVLHDYIEEGYVTIVNWSYNNCVNGMASGRSARWKDSITREDIFFNAPKVISQSAALASCYSRFKRFTEYMMHIDDDEFIALDSSLISRVRKARPLYDFANRIFGENPSAAALSFHPVSKYYCPSLSNWDILEAVSDRSGLTTNVTLPRVGNWVIANKGLPYETKLLMKTSAVRMFFVHYISQIENTDNYDSLPVRLNISDATMLHYKVDPEVEGRSLWGIRLLSSFKPRSESVICKNTDGISEIESFATATAPFVHEIGRRFQESLNRKYRARMYRSLKTDLRP